jgi:hypothetical protein
LAFLGGAEQGEQTTDHQDGSGRKESRGVRERLRDHAVEQARVAVGGLLHPVAAVAVGGLDQRALSDAPELREPGVADPQNKKTDQRQPVCPWEDAEDLHA